MIFPILSDSWPSNSHIIKDDTSVVIDPGIDASRVLEKLNEDNITHYVFINTHCHYDHVGALFGLKNPVVWMHEPDAGALERGDDGMILTGMFGLEAKMVKVERKLKDGQIVKLGKTKLEVIHTPGHTPGSICLYEPESKSLFSGDTLFRDGVGRTDLTGGNFDDLKKSIENLLELHDRRGIEKLYPGHGPVGGGADIDAVYEAYFGK